MAVVQSYYPPVADFRDDYPTRLRIREAPADLSRIADRVEVPLAQLSEAVRQQIPASFSRPGRTKVGTTSLFVYQTFYLPGVPETEPVVVGIAFEPRDNETIIRGDVSGEDSGTVYFELTQRRVDSGHGAILTVALDFASKLAEESAMIVDALTAPGAG